jgi:hypothetical protein
MNKSKIYMDSGGVSGNIFCVLSEALKILNDKNEYDTAEKLTRQVLNAQSYEEALKHIREYADVIDLKGKY